MTGGLCCFLSVVHGKTFPRLRGVQILPWSLPALSEGTSPLPSSCVCLHGPVPPILFRAVYIKQVPSHLSGHGNKICLSSLKLSEAFSRTVFITVKTSFIHGYILKLQVHFSLSGSLKLAKYSTTKPHLQSQNVSHFLTVLKERS